MILRGCGRIFRLDVRRNIINAVQAEHGVSLEAQEAKIRAMATVQGGELIDVICMLTIGYVRVSTDRSQVH